MICNVILETSPANQWLEDFKMIIGCAYALKIYTLNPTSNNRHQWSIISQVWNILDNTTFDLCPVSG